MSEILYIQAGSFANHIGTHFWNAQESYFTYGDGDDPVVFHDRSFREGLTTKGEPTYCPRLLMFDRKSQFGALASDLYADGHASEQNQWEGGIVEYRQDEIPKSQYQSQLDKEELDEELEAGGVEYDASNVRFWSDFSRVYFHPRSLQRLPDLADWQAADGDWNSSREAFQSYESEHELMENEVRMFVEECDRLQGIQAMNDCASFGGFTDRFLTTFRDDFPKLPSLVFPLLSVVSNAIVNAEEGNTMKVLNDALCLRGLENLSSINVPIQNPSTWKKGKWLEDLNLDVRSPYHTSALLATHIESATIPLRLKTSSEDLSSLSSLLNPAGTTRTAHLSGIYPYSASAAFGVEKRIYDLSALSQSQVVFGRKRHQAAYARLHISRGLENSEIKRYDELFTANLAPSPFTIHAPAYPTPSSFPHLAPKETCHNVLTTLTTSGATSKLFASYARVAQECVDHRAEVVTRMGLEFDEARELKDDLWALCDVYAGGDGDYDDEV